MPYTLGTKRLPDNIVDLNDLTPAVSEKLTPEIEAGDAGKMIQIKEDETGYELVVPASGEARFITAPNLSGPSSGIIADGTNYEYTASGSTMLDPQADTLTYNWSIDQGSVTSSTGTSTNAYFGLSQNGTTVTLSCQATDEEGNTSDITTLELSVDATQVPSSLSLSTPSTFVINDAAQLDITVGDDGGDPGLSYYWEVSENDGSTWITTGLSNANIKAPTMTFTTEGLTVKVRCTVTNSAGNTTATSDSLVTVDIVNDADSQFIDSTAHILENVAMEGSVFPTANGPTAEFADTVSEHRIVVVNSTQVVVSYYSGTDFFARVGTVSGDTITYGNEYTVFTGAHTGQFNICEFDTNKVLFSRSDNYPTAHFIIGTISGTTISFGTDQIKDISTNYAQPKTIKLDTNKILMVHSGYGLILTISGDTITFNTQSAQFTATNFNNADITLVGTDKFAVSYNYYSGRQLGNVIVGTISGTTVTFGTLYTPSDSGGNYTSITTVDTDKIVFTYQTGGGGAYETAVVGSISGTVVTFGTPVTVSVAASNGGSVIKFGTNEVLAIYAENVPSYLPTIKKGTISGTDITFGESSTLFPTNCANRFPYAFLDSDTIVVAFNEVTTGTGYHAIVIEPADPKIINVPTGLEAKDTDVFQSPGSSTNKIVSLGNNKVVACYAASSSGMACVGNISGNSIIWETPVVFYATSHAGYTDITVVDTNKVLIVYQMLNGTDDGVGIVGSVTGNSISFGTPSTFESEVATYISLTSVDTNKVVVCYSRSGGRACFGTVSGTDVTWTAYTSTYVGTAQNVNCVNIGTDKVLFLCKAASSGLLGISNLGLISGTTITWQGENTFDASGADWMKAAVTSSSEVVICYRDPNASNHGYSIVGTIGATSITWGTRVKFFASNSTQISVDVISSNQVIMEYRDDDIEGIGKVVIGTTGGGNTITWADPISYSTGMVSHASITNLGDNKFVISYADSDNSGYGTSTILINNTTPFNANDTIQLADGNLDIVASIAAGSSGQDVTLTTNDASAGTVYNLSPSYTVPQIAQDGGQADFREATIEAQWTRNKTSVTEDTGDVVIDHGGSYAAPFLNGDKVLVSGDTDVITTVNADPTRGTVVGDGTPTNNTPAAYNSNTTAGPSIVYIGNDTVVATFYNYGTTTSMSCVGIISGTTIAWGALSQFDNTEASYTHLASIGNNKVVVAYVDAGYSNYATAVVGTVTGNTISWGGDNVYNAGNASSNSITSIGNNKVVTAYRSDNNSNYGHAKVGTVSGTSIGFGAYASFESGTTASDVVVVYTGNDQVMVSYKKGTNQCGVRIGSISGTDTSWWTFQEYVSSAQYLDATSPDTDKIVVIYQDGTNGWLSTSRVGTISGNHEITWGTATTLGIGVGLSHSIEATSTDKVIATYKLGTDRFSIIGTVGATSVTWGNPVLLSVAGSGVVEVTTVSRDKAVASWQAHSSESWYGMASVIDISFNDYNSTISLTDTIPTNVATIESLPLELEADLDDGATVTYAPLTETYEVVNGTTMKATATLSGDQGDFADVKVKAVNTDLNEPTVTRIQVDFGV
jgi:hypothetical protein